MIQYSANSLGVSSRHTTHIGFSFGGFTGIGGTPMNPWVTNDRIAIEYDGVVLTKALPVSSGSITSPPGWQLAGIICWTGTKNTGSTRESPGSGLFSD
jgi:hypothetical protein